MQFQAVMFRALIHRIKSTGFIRDCVLFGSDVPLYWFLGIMVWSSFITFIYASLGLLRLGL